MDVDEPGHPRDGGAEPVQFRDRLEDQKDENGQADGAVVVAELIAVSHARSWGNEEGTRTHSSFNDIQIPMPAEAIYTADPNAWTAAWIQTMCRCGQILTMMPPSGKKNRNAIAPSTA